MNKKSFITLLLSTLIITGIFAVPSTSKIVLTSTMASSGYQFEILYGTESVDEGSTLTDTTLSTITSAVQTTSDPFKIATKAKGNLGGNTVTYNTTITTGAFIGTDNIATSVYPLVIDYPDGVDANLKANEVYNHSISTITNYKTASEGTFSRDFKQGTHHSGTIIAQFKLSIQDIDEELVPDTYTSTSLVSISVN
jgi:hypothetical protein